MMAPNGTTIEELIPVTGVEAAEGFLNNQPMYGDPVWPEPTRALYQEFKKRHPDKEMLSLTVSGFSTTNLYVQAMQAAGSIDPAKVKAVIDDPNFTFDFFGFKEKLGGLKTYGLARWYAFPNALSIVTNGQMKQLDYALVEAP
jgi:ABC-type branched-subunit amino acid transport system substrate-binding protein